MATEVSSTSRREAAPLAEAIATPLAAPQANQQSTIRPAGEAPAEQASGCCDCLWELLGSLWDWVKSIFCSDTTRLQERAGERAADVEQAAEWTRIADDTVSFEARLAEINGELDDRWAWQNVSTPPSIAACHIVIQPSPGLGVGVPYYAQITRRFEEDTTLENMMEEFKGQIRSYLESDRAQNRGSLINSGTRSCGYQLPESTVTLSLIRLTASKGQTFIGGFWAQTIGQEDAELELFPGVASDQIQQYLEKKGIINADLTRAMQKLSGQTT